MKRKFIKLGWGFLSCLLSWLLADPRVDAALDILWAQTAVQSSWGVTATSPTLIQSTNSAMSPESWSDLKIVLNHPTLASNCLIIYVQGGAAMTFTITDDGGNTWNNTPTVSNTTGGQFLYLFVLKNVNAGTQKITVAFGAATTFFGGGCFEFAGIDTSAPLDTSGGTNGSSTTWSATITTGTAGDLIFMVGIQNTSAGNSYFGTSFTLTSPTSGVTNAELIHSDLFSGTVSCWMIQTAKGTITPTITAGVTAGWQTACVALKAATAGTAMPQGVMRVRRRQFSSKNSAQTSNVLQMPCGTGSLVVFGMHSFNSDTNSHAISSIVDQGNNNFFSAAAVNQSISGGNRVDESIWYTPLAASVTPIATITFANTVTEFTASQYEIIGHDSVNTVGATFTTTGTQSVAGNLTAGVITPKRGGSILIAVLPIEIGTVRSTTSPDAFTFDGFTSTGMAGGFNQLEEDNGHGHYTVPASGGQQTFIWTNNNPVGGVGAWGVVIAEFQPPNQPKPRYDHFPPSNPPVSQ